MKIGVFDSGIGGKLIAQKIKKELPKNLVVFKNDPKYFPYGSKTKDIIFKRLVHITKRFIEEGCSIIVIACNSATTSSIKGLRLHYPNIKFVGIEPPVKPITSLTKSNKVAIIGTNATINSNRLSELIEQFAKNKKVHKIACIGLAEAIENRKNPNRLIKKYLDEPVKNGVDTIGIACTHYPYVLPQMKKIYPEITFYDPADAVVEGVKDIINL